MLVSSNGKQKKPQRVVLYGVEGIGKTTAASLMPSPLLLDIERGSYHLDIPRNDQVKTFQGILSFLREFMQGGHEFKTLALDSIDWIQDMIEREVCAANNWSTIEQLGFGKGWKGVDDRIGELLDALTEVAQRYNVFVIAHHKVVRHTLPEEEGEFDRYELKMKSGGAINIAAKVREWADVLLFANYKNYVIEDSGGNKKKAQGGKRVVYTTHHPAYDAKNRMGLPEEFDLDNFGTVISPVMVQEVAQQKQATTTQSTQQTNTTSAPPPKQTGPVNTFEEKKLPFDEPEKKPEPEPETKLDATGDATAFNPQLYSLMQQDGIKEHEIRYAQSKANKGVGYKPIEMPIDNYDDQFAMGILVSKWATIKKKIIGYRETGEMANVPPVKK